MTVLQTEVQWLQVLAGEGSISVKEILETEMMLARAKRDSYQQQVLIQMCQEGASLTDFESILQDENVLSDRYFKAQILFSMGNFDEALELLKSTEQFIKLSKMETKQHQDIISVFTIAGEVYSLAEPKLSQNQRDYLYGLWDSDPFGAGTTASTLLMEFDGFVPEYPENAMTEERSLISSNLKDEMLSSERKDWLYPNPADKISIVKVSEFGGAVSSIELSSSFGKIYMSVPVTNTDVEKALSLSDLESGSYLLTLKGKDGSLIKTTSLIIQH